LNSGLKLISLKIYGVSKYPRKRYSRKWYDKSTTTRYSLFVWWCL